MIIRSTEDAGDITVNVAASGLTGDTVTVKTKAVENEGTAAAGLVSYTMIRDYSVKAGTVPTLNTASTGTLADGTTVTGTIVWDAISEDIYGTAGDYVINGTLTFAGVEPVKVAAKLHVIANVIALRNVSVGTMEGSAPTLPATVKGVLADGTLAGEFNVTWNDVPLADVYDVVGEIVTITGTARIFGEETKNVTCTVRVAEAVNTESVNVALMADSLSQDVVYTSDNLSSIKNGVLKPGDNTNERWTNWSNRTTSDNATLTLTWATAQMVSSVNLYYYYDNCCAYPESLEFSYSLNGQEYTVIGHTAELVEEYYLGALYTYTFEKPINPVGLKVKLTQKNGTSGSNCVGLTEIEVMTYAATFTMNSSADLSAITVDGAAVEGFAADTLAYEAADGNIAAKTNVNAGITVLPEYEGVVRILTVSEDGSAAKTYEITLEKEPECTHDTTEVVGQKAASCTASGYTGDTVCTVCGVTVSTGSTIAMTDHNFDEGQTGADGLTVTFTCKDCGYSEQRTSLEVPEASIRGVKASSNKIKLEGTFVDYDNIEKYYEVTGHGIVYIAKTRLGSRTLTVNTSGRTRVNISSYSSTGTFSYTFKPTNTSTQYSARAFLSYVDEDGVTRYVYSKQIVVSYKTAEAK